MKSIKIMIAASEEMHDEKLEFSNLIEHLNVVLEPRGVELKRVKWNPEIDGPIEEYKAKLRECEMCLTLYWRELAGNSEQELDTAYQELKDGNNPRNLYVFFKEPSENSSDELKGFKDNFVTNYGHFYCKFENVDTLNLHFILQFEVYQNNSINLVDVSDGRVSVCGQSVVNLSNVSFAALDMEYQRLVHQLKQIDEEIASLNAENKRSSDSRNLSKQLITAKEQRNKIKKEFDTYQKHLYSIALYFSQKSAKRYSDRMIQARELFEKGNIIGADRILNLKDLKQETASELTQLEQKLMNLELKIEEFQLKAETVMANTSLDLSVRFEQSCESLDEAILIARKIKYDEAKFATILFNYGTLFQQFNRMKEAFPLYKEALDIRRILVNSSSEVYRPLLAETLNNLGTLSFKLNNFEDAENYFRESLDIRSKLSAINHAVYLPEEATSLGNLGALLLKKNDLSDAERYLHKELDIRRQLASLSPAYKLELAHTLNNVGTLQVEQGCYNEAEKSYQESLLIYYEQADTLYVDQLSDFANVLKNIGNTRLKTGRLQDAEAALLEAEQIHRMLAEYNSDIFLPDLAQTLYNLFAAQYSLGKNQEAQEKCKEALEILQPLVKSNTEAYLPVWADVLFNYGVLQDDLGEYIEAEKSITESLNIFRQLSTTSDYYRNNVADSLNNLAIVQKNQKRYNEAENSYNEALSIYKQLAKEQPDVYLPDLALTLGNYGNLLKKCERYTEARKIYTKALDIYLKINKKHPDSYKAEMEKIVGNMMDAQGKRGPGLLIRQLSVLREWCKNVNNFVIRLFSNS